MLSLHCFSSLLQQRQPSLLALIAIPLLFSNPEETLKQLERKVVKMIEESAMLADAGDIGQV